MIILFNWKRNPKTKREAIVLFDFTSKWGKGLDLTIAPPFEFLKDLISRKGGLKIVSQDIGGKYPLALLKKMGAESILLGHSEKKKYFGETEKTINKKLKSALKSGLSAFLFFGEMEKLNLKEARKEIGRQLRAILKGAALADFQKIFFVYEPVYAISTEGNEPVSPAALKLKLDFVRKFLKTRINLLYGGSVDSRNIGKYLGVKRIDGFVVGQASLNQKEVREIIKVLRA
jgi:triosephosphate isomerase